VVAGPGLGEVEPATPCSQSQIGQGRHLRRQGAAQVEVALVLSVAVRWGPVKTVVNGTLVARPARKTMLVPEGRWFSALLEDEAVPGYWLPRLQEA
jgi:hypothetical protein